MEEREFWDHSDQHNNDIDSCQCGVLDSKETSQNKPKREKKYMIRNKIQRNVQQCSLSVAFCVETHITNTTASNETVVLQLMLSLLCTTNK